MFGGPFNNMKCLKWSWCACIKRKKIFLVHFKPQKPLSVNMKKPNWILPLLCVWRRQLTLLKIRLISSIPSSFQYVVLRFLPCYDPYGLYHKQTVSLNAFKLCPHLKCYRRSRKRLLESYRQKFIVSPSKRFSW